MHYVDPITMQQNIIMMGKLLPMAGFEYMWLQQRMKMLLPKLTMVLFLNKNDYNTFIILNVLSSTSMCPK